MLLRAVYGLLGLAVGLLGGLVIGQRAAAPDDAAPSVMAVGWAALGPDEIATAALFGTVRHVGVSAALDSLRDLGARSPSVRANDHDIAHVLGQFAFRLANDPGVFAQCSPDFQAGCYHGVLQSYFASRPAVDSASVAALCGRLIGAGGSELVRRECAHGVGHGLYGYHGERLGMTLASCDDLGVGATGLECQRGAFMERLTRGMRGGAAHEHHAAPADGAKAPAATVAEAGHADHGSHAAGGGNGSAPASHDEDHSRSTGEAMAAAARAAENPAAWCDDLGDAYQAACWWYVPQLILGPNPESWTRVIAVCDEAPASVRQTCARAAGNGAVAFVRDVPQAMFGHCARLGTGRAECIAGAAEQFVDLDWSGELARGFCGAATGDDRAPCVDGAVGRLALAGTGGAAIRSMCEGAAGAAAACGKAARASIASGAAGKGR